MTSDSVLAEDVLRGKPLRVPVFDCHGHVGPVARFSIRDAGSAESMINIMDRCGIDSIIISSMLGLYHDVVAGNRETCSIAHRYAGRIYGYAVINPTLDEGDVVTEIETCLSQQGMIGVKLHPGIDKKRAADQAYYPVYDYCSRHEVPLLCHTWGDRDIEDFAHITAEFPHLKVILGHSGGPIRSALEKAADLCSGRDGIYLDITCSRTLAGLIEWMVANAPYQKILYGSDLPFIDPRPNLGLVAFSDIPEQQKLRILGENVRDLFSHRLF